MKTDTIFYEIFQSTPAILLELAGRSPQAASQYSFRSVELKQTAFRIDGVLLPQPNASDQTVLFTEVQFQSDSALYHRFFGELFLYLRQYPNTADWQGILIYPQRSIQPPPSPLYQVLLDSAKVVQVYLDELGEISQLPLSLSVIRLIVEPEQTAPEQARSLIRRASQAESTDGLSQATLIQAISTIMVYKFSRLSREEVETMLGFAKELRQTRYFQEVREEALEEGLVEGLKESIVEILSTRFGTVPETIVQQLATVTDAAVLKGFLRQAIAVSSFIEFAEQLN
ncbi:Rpn family recombination-promoting nuclease/putative transposase [Phormidesmis sp. 146-12]